MSTVHSENAGHAFYTLLFLDEHESRPVRHAAQAICEILLQIVVEGVLSSKACIFFGESLEPDQVAANRTYLLDRRAALVSEQGGP